METRLYLVIAIIALGLMCLGYHILKVGGIINIILGIFFLVLGFLLGIMFFGDRWDPPYF